MRFALPLAAVLIVMLACAESGPPSAPAVAAPPATLDVTLDRSGVETLDGGMRSWVFDFTAHNSGTEALNLRYLIHAETPTGDIADRGVFPLAARQALTERVKRSDFGSHIDQNLLSRSAELLLEPGESQKEEGGIVLRGAQVPAYSDVVLFIYNASGDKVGEYPLSQ